MGVMFATNQRRDPQSHSTPPVSPLPTSRRTALYLEPRRRPLSTEERRLLAAKARELRAQTNAPRKIVVLTGGIVGILWLLTILASDAPWWVITLFWILAGSILGLWIRRESRRHGVHAVTMAQRLESALARNEADVFDFSASSYVEFEEMEDEGACYAFDLGHSRIAFVVGQEFYPESGFPSLEFSLVYPLDEHGNTVDLHIDKRGQVTRPARKISIHAKLEFEIPEHLQVLNGELHDLENLLPFAEVE